METDEKKLLYDIYCRISTELEITSVLNNELNLITEKLPKSKKERLVAFQQSYLYGMNLKMISEIFSEIKYLSFDCLKDITTIQSEAQKRMEEIIELSYNAMPTSEKKSIASKIEALEKFRQSINPNKY